MNLPLIVSGLAVGILFGFTLQHGRFCMNTAFREVLLSRDFTVFRIYILALLISIIGANVFDQLGLIHLRSVPFTWLANMLGGYLFGIGMVLGGGCATGTLYRIGEGMIGSWVAALGFIIAATATLSGALKPVANFFWFGPGFDPEDIATAKFLYAPTDTEGNPLPVTIFSIFHLNRWLVIILIAVPALIFISKGKFKKPESQKGFNWWVTGILIGLISIIGFYSSEVWGGFTKARGLSFTGPLNELLSWFAGEGTLTWSVWMVIGLVLGSLISATRHKEFGWRAPKAQSLVTQFAGGLIMGFGGSLAGGCNVGHGLTGLSTLALGSLVGIIFIVLGSWTMVYFLFIRE